MMMVLAFAVVMLAPAVAREFAAMRRSFNVYLSPSIVPERLPWVLSVGLVAFLYASWTITHYGFNDNAVGTDVISRLPLSAILGLVFVAFFVVAYRRGMRGADDGAQVLLVLLGDLGSLAVHCGVYSGCMTFSAADTTRFSSSTTRCGSSWRSAVGTASTFGCVVTLVDRSIVDSQLCRRIRSCASSLCVALLPIRRDGGKVV